MTDPQVRLGCLELAAQLIRPTNNYSPESVVQTAQVLYNFTQAQPTVETPAAIADKQRPKLTVPKGRDILS